MQHAGQPITGLHYSGQPIRGLHYSGQPIRGLHYSGQPIRGLHYSGQPIRGLHYSGQPIRGLHYSTKPIDAHSNLGIQLRYVTLPDFYQVIVDDLLRESEGALESEREREGEEGSEV